MKERHSRGMSEQEIDRTVADVRTMAREHPLAIPRKVGEYVNLIVQGCKEQNTYLVDLGHVCLQGLGLELAETLIAQTQPSKSAGGDDERG